jgi:hypothetical protein
MEYRRPARFPWNYDCGGAIANTAIYPSFGFIGATNDSGGSYLIGVLR